MRMSSRTVEPDPQALEVQHSRQRRRSRRMTIGAFAVVAAIGLAAVAASIVGAFAGGNSTTPADEAVTTTQTGTGADVESSAELQSLHMPVKLRPGRVSTDEDSGIVVTFSVPPGWFGYQDKTGFVLGMGLVGDEVDVWPGGITVDVVDFTLAQAARRLEQVEGIQVRSPIRIGGSPGRRYARRLGVQHEVRLQDLGLPGVVVPLHTEADLILLGAGGKTLVIRRHFTKDADRAEVDRVLMSFRFPR